jgi:hypothetical protein
MYKKLLLFALFTVILTGWHNSVLANFIQYSNESSWQAAAGTTVLEDFESYSVGDTFSSLPALGVGFTELSGGGFPNIYRHPADVTPYGRNHLGNFPNGINSINRWADTTMFVLSGYNIKAVGFWNGDGQADTLFASAYDANGVHLGDIGAFKGTFAGFISDVAISRVVFDGNTGDGWNHLDGLQTNATVPIPGAVWLLSSGIASIVGIRLRRKKK